MQRIRLLFVLLAVITSGAVSAGGQNDAGKTTSSANAEVALDGDWHGESICEVRESACRDEDSLYQFSKILDKDKAKNKAGRYSLKADKIVGGKRITMGTSECSYDQNQRVLECAISADATLRFTLKGDTLQGTMTIQGSKLWRRLTLKKVGA